MFRWASFLSYAVVTAATPGPNNIMSMSNAGRLGFRKSFPFNLGIWIGFSLVMLICSFFCNTLSAIIPKIKTPMLILGALYMLFLAWKTFKSPSVIDESHARSSLFSGFILQFINPKIYVYGILSMEAYILPYYHAQPVPLVIFSLLLAWIGLGLCLSIRVVRYRRACRRAVEAGETIPVPGRGAARFRGAAPLLYTVLGIAIVLLVLAGVTSFGAERTTFDEGGYSRVTVGHSVLADTKEYRTFSDQGDLWLESYDCKAPWLASMICGSLRKAEGNEKQLHYYNHDHGTVELTEADLGYDMAWIYAWDGGNGLIIRQGNRVIHMEAEKLDLTDRTVVEEQLVWLEQAACTLT